MFSLILRLRLKLHRLMPVIEVPGKDLVGDLGVVEEEEEEVVVAMVVLRVGERWVELIISEAQNARVVNR
jgi:hypothetical protein